MAAAEATGVGGVGGVGGVSAEDVRAIALTLPRAYEAFVYGRVKFRVGRLVFLSLSPDQTELGFGYPKEERAALIASDPEKFLLPQASDMRYNWMRVRLAKLDRDELWELVVDSWRMVVPKFVREAFFASPQGRRPGVDDEGDVGVGGEPGESGGGAGESGEGAGERGEA